MRPIETAVEIDDQLDTESAERSEVKRQRRPNEPTVEEVAAHEEHHEP